MQSDTLATETHEKNERTLLGFWIYLMTDIVLFATLFATYVVLRTGTNGGPTGADIFDLPFVLVETLVLLTSSFTSGLMMIAVRRQKVRQIICWLVVTMILGIAFLTLELTEFGQLISEGHSWRESAFLSAFFTLVGTHGLHILFGLLWAFVLMGQLIAKKLTANVERRLSLFAMFWHFLDIVWIFIFTIVYLLGVL
ncbi:MAG TPA: cytochrome o ubiquinol oxidase subunit III [Candidatus Saccharimonadales bacterium]|nr:cytochrome o ubiquinol oxidase subunit III [Candidatus Saccharimonadales bacterium]